MGKSFTLFLAVVFLSIPAYGWHTDTHYQMTSDAISLMPQDLQTILLSNKKFVEAGIKDPDEMIRDWQNHYYIPSAPPEGGAIDRVDKIIKIVQTKLKGTNSTDTGKQLCYLAHYIADIWNPENLIKATVHQDASFVQNQDIVVLFQGYSVPVDDYRNYLVTRAQWRWRLENTSEVSRILYSEAVNDIATIWLSLWQQSGKNVAPVPPRLIEHKKGALYVNYAQLLAEEWET
jgi:hypothetical protein